MKNTAFRACFIASLLVMGMPAPLWATSRMSRLPHKPFAQSGAAPRALPPAPNTPRTPTARTATPPPRYSDGTGNELVDRLNNAQLNQNYRGPYYYPGQPVPPFQATAPNRLPAFSATPPSATPSLQRPTPPQPPSTLPASKGTPFR